MAANTKIMRVEIDAPGKCTIRKRGGRKHCVRREAGIEASEGMSLPYHLRPEGSGRKRGGKKVSNEHTTRPDGTTKGGEKMQIQEPRT